MSTIVAFVFTVIHLAMLGSLVWIGGRLGLPAPDFSLVVAIAALLAANHIRAQEILHD